MKHPHLFAGKMSPKNDDWYLIFLDSCMFVEAIRSTVNDKYFVYLKELAADSGFPDPEARTFSSIDEVMEHIQEWHDEKNLRKAQKWEIKECRFCLKELEPELLEELKDMDGSSCWGTEDKVSYVPGYSPRPKWATHIYYYSK